MSSVHFSRFQMDFIVTTLTTTGYGDITPVTTAGKVIAAVAMMAGVTVTMIALPVSIIGTNFMNEWMNHQRVQLQKKMEERRRDFDDLLGPKDAETASRGSKGKIGRSKGATIKILREERDLISQVVLEVQDRLADINPPKYYSRYKEMQKQYYAACEKIKELEAEVQELKKLAKPLIDPYVASPATSPLSARFLLKPSARNTLQSFKIAHHTHHISHPIGRSLTNPVEPSIPRLHQTSPSGRGGRTSNVHRIRNKLRSLINKQDDEGAFKTSEISIVPGSLAPMFTSMSKQQADSGGVTYEKREVEESGAQKDARTTATVTKVPTISVELPSPTEPDIPEDSDEVEASVMSMPCTGKEIEWVRGARKMLKKSQVPENTDPARPTRSLHDLFQQPRNDATANSTSTSLPHQLDPSRSSLSNQHSPGRRNSLDDIPFFAGTIKPPPPDGVIISLED
ncbi:hypothetical protein BKA69DRAFT_9538 [Paraphysoderma sedebokerense]|nr:hypothetical protein BKA69DRAFT_9538 [Paraphysoderma sedebokerense]